MSKDNIVYLDGTTELSEEEDTRPSAQDALDMAGKAGLEEVVVLGYTESGDMYFSTSTPDIRNVVWLLAHLQNKLLNGDFS